MKGPFLGRHRVLSQKIPGTQGNGPNVDVVDKIATRTTKHSAKLSAKHSVAKKMTKNTADYSSGHTKESKLLVAYYNWEMCSNCKAGSCVRQSVRRDDPRIASAFLQMFD